MVWKDGVDLPPSAIVDSVTPPRDLHRTDVLDDLATDLSQQNYNNLSDCQQLYEMLCTARSISSDVGFKT
jgi:hypothetical protein